MPDGEIELGGGALVAQRFIPAHMPPPGAAIESRRERGTNNLGRLGGASLDPFSRSHGVRPSTLQAFDIERLTTREKDYKSLDQGIRALPDAHAIRIMLADLEGFEDMDPDEVGAPVNVARRASLLADFRALQLLID